MTIIDRLKSRLRWTRAWREVVAPFSDRARAPFVARHHRDSLEHVERFVFFIGYPRSGHSLLGALLNAHPDALVAHELNALTLLEPGLEARRLYARLILRDRWFASLGRRWGGHDYNVPGQWQGKWRRLRVIGDKRGAGTTQAIALGPRCRRAPQGDRHLPTEITGSTGTTGIAAGFDHTCSTKSDGTRRCWGNNTEGEFGNGGTADSTVPVLVNSF